jgi:small subunit ribosomal protein S24e
MEVIERRENPMLDRVELRFRWDHPNSPTPSLTQMVEAATKAEPGSKKNLVFVKNVNTRFGMARTSGIALVYGSEESASIEQSYVIERHKSATNSEPKVAAESPEPPAAAPEEAPEIDGDGGGE